ncbi:MAG: hypothetical protein U0175_06790 [Caldilineaceae bacterium]
MNKQLSAIMRVAQEEDGLATTLTLLALMGAILALMLLFIPFMDNFTSRRFAQNGGDAAAHAAAGYYADQYSISYGLAPNVPYLELSTAFCVTHPVAPSLDAVRDQARQRTVQLYKAYYALQTQAQMGAARAEASRYANENHTQLRRLNAWISFIHTDFKKVHEPSRETLYPVLTDAEAFKTFTPWTNQSHDVPGAAAAIAYVKKVEAVVDTPAPSPDFWETTEPPVPCTTWTVMYRYSWQINLVRKVPNL